MCCISRVLPTFSAMYDTFTTVSTVSESFTHWTTQLRLTRLNSFSHNSAVSYATITQWCIFQGGGLYEITQWCIFQGVELYKITQWCIFQGGELYKITQWCIFQGGELYNITQWCIFYGGELYNITQWCIFQAGELYKITQWCIFHAGELWYKITQKLPLRAGKGERYTAMCCSNFGSRAYKHLVVKWSAVRNQSEIETFSKMRGMSPFLFVKLVQQRRTQNYAKPAHRVRRSSGQPFTGTTRSAGVGEFGLALVILVGLAKKWCCAAFLYISCQPFFTT